MRRQTPRRAFADTIGDRWDERDRPVDRVRIGVVAAVVLSCLLVSVGFGVWPAIRASQRQLNAAPAARLVVTASPTPTPRPPTPPPAPPPTATPAPAPPAVVVVSRPATPPPTPTPLPPTPPPPIKATVTVPAAGGWVSTGVTVTSGRSLAVSSSGSWTGGPPETGTVGPDGSSQAWPDNFFDLQELGKCNFCATIKTPHWEALVGYIGSDPPPPGSYQQTSILSRAQRVFLVGSSLQTTAGSSGTLWLAMNDDAYSANGGDNSGQLTAQVTAGQ